MSLEIEISSMKSPLAQTLASELIVILAFLKCNQFLHSRSVCGMRKLSQAVAVRTISASFMTHKQTAPPHSRRCNPSRDRLNFLDASRRVNRRDNLPVGLCLSCQHLRHFDGSF